MVYPFVFIVDLADHSTPAAPWIWQARKSCHSSRQSFYSEGTPPYFGRQNGHTQLHAHTRVLHTLTRHFIWNRFAIGFCLLEAAMPPSHGCALLCYFSLTRKPPTLRCTTTWTSKTPARRPLQQASAALLCSAPSTYVLLIYVRSLDKMWTTTALSLFCDLSVHAIFSSRNLCLSRVMQKGH
jgi:hypothetical protein